MLPAATHWSLCWSRIAIDIASSRLTTRSVAGGGSMACFHRAHDGRLYPSFWDLMSYLKNTPASSDPSAFCGLYSSSTLANCSATPSAVAAESPDPLGLTP